MDQDARQGTADNGGIRSVGETSRARSKASARRMAWHAWFVRVAAVTFLAGGAFISYLFFSTV